MNTPKQRDTSRDYYCPVCKGDEWERSGLNWIPVHDCPVCNGEGYCSKESRNAWLAKNIHGEIAFLRDVIAYRRENNIRIGKTGWLLTEDQDNELRRLALCEKSNRFELVHCVAGGGMRVKAMVDMGVLRIEKDNRGKRRVHITPKGYDWINNIDIFVEVKGEQK